MQPTVCQRRKDDRRSPQGRAGGPGRLISPAQRPEREGIPAAEPSPLSSPAAAPAVWPPPPLSFACGTRWDFARPCLLGIVNVTPDSFSDGGRFLDPDVAAAHALGMVLDGADALDLGAESSRPGSRGVSAREQKARLLPVLKRLRRTAALRRIPIGIDTRSAEVFRACLGEGADLLNDISALRHDRTLARLVARAGCPVILMHMRGTPRTMQNDPRYADVVGDIQAFFRARLRAALDAGVTPARVLLDPGIGFGKTVEHNCELLRRLGEFRRLGRPLVVGASRKSFLGKLGGEPTPSRRAEASVVAGLLAVRNGASVLRVHDVGEHARALRVAAALI